MHDWESAEQHFASHQLVPAAARLPSTLLPLQSPAITSLVLTAGQTTLQPVVWLPVRLLNSVCGKGSPPFAGWGGTWSGNQPALGACCPVLCCQKTSSLRLATHRGRKASTAAIAAPRSDLCAQLSTFPPPHRGWFWCVTGMQCCPAQGNPPDLFAYLEEACSPSGRWMSLRYLLPPAWPRAPVANSGRRSFCLHACCV